MPSIHDWRPYSYELPETELNIDVHDEHILVDSKIDVQRKSELEAEPLFLNGSNLELIEISVDGTKIGNNEYLVDEKGLTVFNLPDRCLIEIKQKFVIPDEAVDGLYYSGDTLVTQCEDEAFRKIAFFADRPDVLSKFKVRVEADRVKFPTLLSNGDVVAEEDLEESRHAKTYLDPFPKPSYLFAMSAGNLASMHSTFTTKEDVEVDLTIYSDPKSIRNCAWAMECLKLAMAWDEQQYNRVYDLERFSIVAVEKFVFGAMENKSLNVFNNSVLLASPDVATDETYERIRSVVGHEYFHNYSGNRVTVRDWFQLSLKEGLTVLRDQSFTRYVSDFNVHRILDADFLRREQFPEAQSGLSHPVQPEEMEVPANYYTRTIYEGGAEIAYMLSNLLGRDDWISATDRYFSEFDGQAVTINDFVDVIAAASNRDLSAYKLWYSTSGTPQVTINESREDGTIKLSIESHVPPTADQAEKPELLIPMGIGVVSEEQGNLLTNPTHNIEIETEAERTQTANLTGTEVIACQSPSTEVRLLNVPEDAQVSVLRDFSAPVEVTYQQQDDDSSGVNRLVQLALHDRNAFSRWDAVQQLLVKAVLGQYDTDTVLNEVFTNRLEYLLEAHPSFASQLRCIALEITLPYEGRILDLHKGTLVEDIVTGLDRIETQLAETHAESLRKIATKFEVKGPYEPTSTQITARVIRSLCYRYLLRSEGKSNPQGFAEELAEQFRKADNLSDRLTFFKLLLEVADVDDLKGQITEEFYDRYKDNALIVERWISAQVRAPIPGVIDRIESIRSRGLLERATPNRWRSVYGAYTENWQDFHRRDGTGYDFYTDRLVADAEEHASVVRRGIQPLAYWHRHDPERSAKMRACLERLGDELPQRQIAALDMVKRGLRVSPAN